MQGTIDKENAAFWDELCGTMTARSHGIQDRSVDSLKKFDNIYFDYYPYLLKHVPIDLMKGKKVLEVGLGFGTLGGKIAQNGADYTGLDIAMGPVKMMNHRLQLLGLPGKAVQGSILASPFADASMDFVVSIGCYHHTGDLQRAIDETYRILKPGGHAMLMVYNQRSYRQWLKWPIKTTLSLLSDYNILNNNQEISDSQKAAYDYNSSGKSAPETVFASISKMKWMMSKFSHVNCTKENWNDLVYPFYRILPRIFLLKTAGKVLGLDIYISAVK